MEERAMRPEPVVPLTPTPAGPHPQRAGLEGAPAEGSRVLIKTPTLTWIDVSDPAGPALDALAERYGFHELAVEDSRNHPQLAKIDQFSDHLFLIANSIRFTPETGELELRELDFFIGRDYLVTVHEGPSLAVESVVARLQGDPRLRKPAQILYALLDTILDRFMQTLGEIGHAIDELEERVLDRLDKACLEKVFTLRRNLVSFRRAASAQREMLNALSRRDSKLVPSDMVIYFRDVYDHVVATMEMIESYRDLLSAVLEIYLTQSANRTNEVVKGLTIIATIILPLTLIVGWYGMNFEWLPFATDPHGVWYVTGAMAVFTVTLLIYFRRKGWF